MSRLAFGGLAGLLFGVVSVALMLPLSFPDKRAALTGAFLNRFAIGLLIPRIALPGPGWAVGLGLGVLLSLPDGIITKALGPIVGVGALGGLWFIYSVSQIVVTLRAIADQLARIEARMPASSDRAVP
jgi:hypothetical protein